MTSTPERDFLLWLSTREFMVVKKHRAEVRTHLVKALASSPNEQRTQ